MIFAERGQLIPGRYPPVFPGRCAPRSSATVRSTCSWRKPRAALPRAHYSACVRLVIARCSVDYDGRLTAHLPSALRLLIVKADGSVLVHSDGGSYKPLNWMSPPCRLTEQQGDG